MRKFIFSFLILTVFGLGVGAQTNAEPPKSGLPAEINLWEDSAQLLNDPEIKIRLKRLLGEENYAAFVESFETVAPIVKKENIIFSSGCLIHACTHLESAIAVDPVNKTVHAAIYRRGEKTRYFNENRRRTPKLIRNWVNRLSSINQKGRAQLATGISPFKKPSRK